MRLTIGSAGFSILVATVAFTSLTSGVGADEKVATLKLERKDQLIGSAHNHTVFVNDEKVGKIPNGSTKEFTFVPKPDGKNTIYVEAYDPFITNPKTKTITFAVFEGGTVNAKVEWEQVGLTFELALKLEVATKGKEGPKLISVKMDPKLKSVVLRESPPVRLAAGSEKVVEDTRKILHAVTITNGWKTEEEIRGKISAGWLEIGAGIKSGVEQSTSKTYSVETECKRSVKLVGDGSTLKSVVWVEYFRTGIATWNIDGREVKIPFEIKEDFDLVPKDGE